MRSKYNARRTSCGEHIHASKKEAIRCTELQLLVKAKHICSLETQPRFRLVVNGQHICDYIADFSYTVIRKFGDLASGAKVIEDSKGVRTDVYRVKCKLMKALYGIEIKET